MITDPVPRNVGGTFPAAIAPDSLGVGRRATPQNDRAAKTRPTRCATPTGVEPIKSYDERKVDFQIENSRLNYIATYL